MFEYKIPQEIKTKFTKEFMADFLVEIIRVFNLSEPISYSDSIIYLESTCGWADAFKYTCQKHKIEDVLTYYDNLQWYDSDLFDDEFGDLLVEYELVKDTEDTKDDDYPCNTCATKDSCDGWDAQFCCALCRYYSDELDCENCDPMDI